MPYDLIALLQSRVTAARVEPMDDWVPWLILRRAERYLRGDDWPRPERIGATRTYWSSTWPLYSARDGAELTRVMKRWEGV
jgi:hypothetical protein